MTGLGGGVYAAYIYMWLLLSFQNWNANWNGMVPVNASCYNSGHSICALAVKSNILTCGSEEVVKQSTFV